MKVALIHYWLTGMRGGEKVLEALADLYPTADIFTHVCVPEALSSKLRQRRIQTTFIGRLPWAKRCYKAYLPLMPLALEGLDLSAYDLVISSESGPAKNVITRPDALHLCYCHSPMRYLWDQAPAYGRNLSWPTRWLWAPTAHYLRLTDVVAAARVDAFAANSTFVQARIKKFYRRDATLIHPPVDTDFFTPGQVARQEHYLVAGHLVAYKRVDLAVAACTQLNLPLVVAGQGPELARLQALAGPTVRFVGAVDNEALRELLRSCQALLFPGVEDFGLVPVEAMACGAPVIALGQGGVRDSVLPGRTGIFFTEQSVSALMDALQDFAAQKVVFDPARLRARAEDFALPVFMEKIQAWVQALEGQAPGRQALGGQA